MFIFSHFVNHVPSLTWLEATQLLIGLMSAVTGTFAG